MKKLVGKNDTETKYCFILDSVDGLISKNDLDKSFEDSKKVAGGAVIASDFMKRVSIALAKRGHMAIFISQVRADIKLDPYSKAPIRQTSATGGNALLHFSNWILEFEPSFKSDLILEKPNEKPDKDKNKTLGRYAKVTVKKSPNEKTNMVIPYPILFGRTGGNSIWIEKEILDMMFIFEFANKKGAGWIEFDKDFVQMAGEDGVEFPEKIQGETKFFNMLTSDEKCKNFLLNYFKKSLSQS